MVLVYPVLSISMVIACAPETPMRSEGLHFMLNTTETGNMCLEISGDVFRNLSKQVVNAFLPDENIYENYDYSQ